MPAVAALSTAVLASEGHREATVLARPPPPAVESHWPMKGLLALCERPAGVMAVTTLSEVLSRISGSTEVCFGHYLRELCENIAAVCGGSELNCEASDAALPIGTAVTLRLIADLLITNALVHAFPTGVARRITVCFTAAPEDWQLVVEDSGIAMSADDRRDNGLTIARLLVRRHDGQLEIPSMTGGTRCVVAIPRATRT